MKGYADPAGVPWPSVSKVLGQIKDASFIKFVGDVGTIRFDSIMKDASAIGKDFHDAVERYANKQAAELTEAMCTLPKAKAAMRSYKLYQARFNPAYLANEVTCISKRYQFVCRFDSIHNVKLTDSSKMVMIDYKTSAEVSNTYVLQLAANAQAYFEETGIWLNDGAVIRVNKSFADIPLCEVHVYTNLRRFIPPFVSLLRAWRFFNQFGGWSKAMQQSHKVHVLTPEVEQ